MKTNTQNGSVIFYILLAIVLFAALGFAVSSSMRGGASALDDELVDLKAEELISYSAKVYETVKTLQLVNDCDETELSFENDDAARAAYVNSSAIESCKIFSPQGGGLNFQEVDAQISTNDWEFVGGRIHGVGTSTLSDSDSMDLLMILSGISDALCLSINKKLGLNETPVDSGDLVDATPNKFDGALLDDDNITGSSNDAHTCGDTEALLCNRQSACFKEASGGELNVFYKVLIAR